MVVWKIFRTFVVNENGNRIVFYLNDDGKRWYLYWSHLSSSVCVSGRVAVSGNSQ